MSANFKMSKKKREPYFEMNSSHYHKDYEIYFLIKGTRRFFVEDSIYNLNGGDVVVIPKGVLHRTTYLNNLSHERYNVIFSGEYFTDLSDMEGDNLIEKTFENKPVVTIPQSKRDYVNSLFELLYAEFNGNDKFRDINIKNHLQEIIIFLIRCLDFPYDNSGTELDTSDSLIQEAARYISNNYGSELTLSKVAAQVNMSPTYFSKKFKECTGFGYKEYLINVRLRKASFMLLETKKSVTEIASDCGFNDSNYFGDLFRRSKGISPLNYRKNNTFI